jgi:hypothetical protein
LAPQASARFAQGLWEHQIANHRTGGFDRHAPFFEHGPMDGKDFARHAGFYIGTWCYAWKHGGFVATNRTLSVPGAGAKNDGAAGGGVGNGDLYLRAIETLLARFERKRVQKDGSLAATIGPLECELAATMVPEPLATRLRTFAATEDALILTDLRKQVRGGTNSHVPKWQNGYSAGTLANQAMFCLARYEQTTNAAYRELLIEIAEAYFGSRPEEDLDAWPQSFAHVISTQLAAYRWTKKAAHQAQARQLARLAVETFWQDNPLPRASRQTGHYETITGADSLALALLETHVVLNNLPTRIPSNTLDR